MKIILKNALVYSMEENNNPSICDVVVDGKIISKVGTNLNIDAEKTIDCSGKIIMPGLIDAHCHIGIFGTAMGEKGIDGNEYTCSCTPQLRAVDAINPLDEEFKQSYSHGVTCVCTGPGSSNPIAGQFVTMKTHGTTLESMILHNPAAMKMAFGENPKSARKEIYPTTRMGTASIIREALLKANRYLQDKERALKENKTLPPLDTHSEALIDVLSRKIPVKAHAHRADDIITALRISREFNLDISIEHCSEGHFIIEELEGVRGVVLGPLLGFPHKLEVINQTPKAAKIYCEKGIKFAIMSDLPAGHTWSILLAAGECVREGLDILEAMKALTIYPAEILSIEERVGSIKKGKDADIVVFSSNPLEKVNAKCELTIINGRIVHNSLEENNGAC